MIPEIKKGHRFVTRCGCIAKIYSTQGAGPYIYHGAVEFPTGWVICVWNKDCKAADSRYDLLKRIGARAMHAQHEFKVGELYATAAGVVYIDEVQNRLDSTQKAGYAHVARGVFIVPKGAGTTHVWYGRSGNPLNNSDERYIITPLKPLTNIERVEHENRSRKNV